MLHDDSVGVAHKEATRNFAFIYSPCRSTCGCLQVNSLVVSNNVLIHRVLLLTEPPADKTFLYGPWQFAFVLLEAACYELLLLGKGGLGSSLLPHYFIDFLVE